jgi:hypothetical protein
VTTRVLISGRTWILGLAGAIGLAAFAFVVFASPDAGTARLAYLDVFFIIAAAVVILLVATSFKPGEALWRQWMLIGIGVASYAVGDVVWAFDEIVLKSAAPSPGLPDVFYVITTIALSLGVLRAAIAFRRVSVKMRAPLAVTGALVVAAVGAESVLVLGGVVGDPTLSAVAKILNVYYPLQDIVLLFGPALFIVLVVSRLGRGALGWPWWAVASGLACMSVSDIVFSAMQTSGTYVAGSPIDLGWMAGFILLAIGASIAHDVAHPVRDAPVSEG